MSKRRATTTLHYVAADLGLDVTGFWPGSKRAHGQYRGVEIEVVLTDQGRPSAADRERGNASGLAGDWWMLQATTTHADLGCGFAISGPERVRVPKAGGSIVITGDAEFDDLVATRATDVSGAVEFLDEATRRVVRSFFESGVEALITDTAIIINPQLTSRALTSRLRNAAQMSRYLETRVKPDAVPPAPPDGHDDLDPAAT